MAKVLWRPLHEQERTSTVALSMPVIEDLDEVHTRDEKIFARGVTALGSLKVLAAASAYERGDDSTANSLLDEARGVFGMSADALAGDATVEVDSLRTKYRSSNAQERKSLNYGLQKKTLAHFGKENEGY
jgi:Ca-activated chloride channel family protein